MDGANLGTALIDNSLIAVSWLATCSFICLSLAHRLRRPRTNQQHPNSNRSISINLYLVGIVLASFCLFAWLTNTHVWNVPNLLWTRVFDGTNKRVCLLLFWALATLESLIFSLLVHFWAERANTCHRKFFHLTVSLIAISGLFHDPKFLTLSSHLVLQIFIIVEVLRNQRVQPWANSLDQWLLIFVDGQDSPELILTPIFLLAGVLMPLLADTTRIHSAEWTLKQRHFAGVLTVGVGDSFAALVGTRFGRTPWSSFTSSCNRKTLEGSMAMFLSQIAVSLLLFGFCSLNAPLFLVALLSTLAEAHLAFCDNLIVPLSAMLVFAFFDSK